MSRLRFETKSGWHVAFTCPRTKKLFVVQGRYWSKREAEAGRVRIAEQITGKDYASEPVVVVYVETSYRVVEPGETQRRIDAGEFDKKPEGES